jgi:predicted transcriptional regulator
MMKNEVAFRHVVGSGEEITITIMGGKALSVIKDTKMYSILEDMLDYIEPNIDVDMIFQIVDAQIRKTYNTQAVMLKSVEFEDFNTGVVVYAIR